ncbi:hypothetical protein [Serratia proteamaculans]|uniref:hypothetical protein n=1 Tax=Serratia proteamaculans TaxID=28151 RepID=UPI0021777F7C|nr:hypothetical protein [Serratia proteamaculans]CAI1664993.1 Uncharacterised protein [Serratia proteamaculans]
MAGLSQKLKAVISFGGNIDSSWGRSTDGLKKGLSSVEKQSEKLTKQQKVLALEMKQAKLAGKDIAGLKRDYAGVTREIKKADAAQVALNRDLQRAERLRRFGSGAKTAAGRTLKAGIGMTLGGGALAAAAGAILSPVNMNAQTAESVGKARTYGVGIETYNAWDSFGKQMGLNGENFGDLLEELKNKVGEYKATGEQSSLNDAFKMLKFGAGDFSGLTNEQQFEKIMERALTHKDEQEAASAVDMLMGGEANKILTYMRLTGKSYKEMMDQQKRYNLVTKEGADGAIRGNIAFSNLRSVWGSAVEEIAGKLGGSLAPKVTQLADELSAWFKNGGIDIISTTIRNKWIPNLVEFANGIMTVTKLFLAIARKLAWLLPDEQSDKKAIVRSLGKGDIEGARDFAQTRGQSAWLESILKAPEKQKALQGIYSDAQYSLSSERIMSPGAYWDKADDRMLAAIGETDKGDDPLEGAFSFLSSLTNQGAAGDKPAMTDNRRQEVNMTVIAQPGQDAQAVADSVVSSMKNMDVFNGNNAMHDPAEAW